jgi:hypothetical protein
MVDPAHFGGHWDREEVAEESANANNVINNRTLNVVNFRAEIDIGHPPILRQTPRVCRSVDTDSAIPNQTALYY